MNKKIIIPIITITLVLFSALTYIFFLNATAKKTLPTYGRIKNFELTDSNNSSFNLSQLKNKVWVADFIFTTCGTICPIMTKNMASLHRSYKLDDRVDFISVSVNPEYDTPKRLKEFSNKYQADTQNWHFLTGSRKKIRDVVVGSFKLGSIEEPIFHSAKFVLVDTQRNIRGYYDGTETKEINELFKDIALLLKE